MFETIAGNKPAAKREPGGETETSVGIRLTREVEHASGFSNFRSNLKDFLTEKQVTVRGGGPGFLPDTRFGTGWKDNLKDFFRPLPASAKRTTDGSLLVEWQPWYRELWQNIRDRISPPKLPPLELTSKPVPVREIWSRNPRFKGVQAVSLLVHVVLIMLIVAPFVPGVLQKTQAKKLDTLLTPLDISPYTPKLPKGAKKAGGGGGGGERNPIPASRGKLPKFSWTQFTPPAVKPPDNAKLAMTPTVLGPPDLKLPSPNMANWGDPLAKAITDSSGPGSGAGIGSGCCGGVGSGQGGGVGPGNGWGTGGGYPSAGTNGYGDITCIYCPQPAYSDEAVKTKFQGTVLVHVLVTPDGRAANIRIVKGIGMGLDEKVIEAVRTWRFKPSTGPNGKPTTAVVDIEVGFRLL
jgi:TonB family protein